MFLYSLSCSILFRSNSYRYLRESFGFPRKSNEEVHCICFKEVLDFAIHQVLQIAKHFLYSFQFTVVVIHEQSIVQAQEDSDCLQGCDS